MAELTELTELEIFDDVAELPNDEAKARYEALVGIDEYKEEIQKMAHLWFKPSELTNWSNKHYKTTIPIVDRFLALPHLIVLAGDVGTGKSTLAETVGDAIGRLLGIKMTLYRLSMTSRGVGIVGDITRRLSFAFNKVKEKAGKGKEAKSGIIFLIDEADAIVQSRDLKQMHHEDRAGVNTVIRGISDLANLRQPILTILCTNRLGSIDPAVRRRAARVFEFARPNAEQRKKAFEITLDGLGFNSGQLDQLVDATGENGRGYGFTYSDIVQQLVPAILLDAFPTRKVEFESAIKLAKAINPSPPFTEDFDG